MLTSHVQLNAIPKCATKKYLRALTPHKRHARPHTAPRCRARVQKSYAEPRAIEPHGQRGRYPLVEMNAVDEVLAVAL